jgi:hypothetical protein
MSKEAWTKEEGTELAEVLSKNPTSLKDISEALEKKTGYRRTPGALAIKIHALGAIGLISIGPELRKDLRTRSAVQPGRVRTPRASKEPKKKQPSGGNGVGDEWLNISQAIALTSLSAGWIRRCALNRRVRRTVVGGHFVFHRADLLAIPKPTRGGAVTKAKKEAAAAAARTEAPVVVVGAPVNNPSTSEMQPGDVIVETQPGTTARIVLRGHLAPFEAETVRALRWLADGVEEGKISAPMAREFASRLVPTT